MAVGDAYVFPGFLTPVLTLLFFPKPPTTFFTCFCRGERRKYAGTKSRLNWELNSQPPGHESDTLTTEPPGRGKGRNAGHQHFILFPLCFQKPTFIGSFKVIQGKGSTHSQTMTPFDGSWKEVS